MDGYGLGYLYFPDFGRATDIMFLVGWLPDPPDQISKHIENKIEPIARLPFSHSLLSYSVTSHHNLTGSFSLLHSQLSPSLSSSRAHGSFLSSLFSWRLRSRRLLGVSDLGVLDLGVWLGFQISAFAWGSTSRRLLGVSDLDICSAF